MRHKVTIYASKDTRVEGRNLKRTIRVPSEIVIEGDLTVEVERIERYVKVWFLPERPQANSGILLYTYIDPWGNIGKGEFVLAGYKSAPAVVMEVDVEPLHGTTNKPLIARAEWIDASDPSGF